MKRHQQLIGGALVLTIVAMVYSIFAPSHSAAAASAAPPVIASPFNAISKPMTQATTLKGNTLIVAANIGTPTAEWSIASGAPAPEVCKNFLGRAKEKVCQTKPGYDACLVSIKQGTVDFCALGGDANSPVRRATADEAGASLFQKGCKKSMFGNIYTCPVTTGSCTSYKNFFELMQTKPSPVAGCQLAALAPPVKMTQQHALSDKVMLFARGLDGALWYSSSPNGVDWSAWNSLGGQIEGDPDAASDSKGNVYVFARAADGSISNIRRMNGTWTGWMKVPTGATNASPSVAMANLYSDKYLGKLLFLCVRSALNNELAYNVYDPQKNKWGLWRGLGGVLSSGPDVVFYPTKEVIAHVRATNGTIAYRQLIWEAASGDFSPGGFSNAGGFSWTNWATRDNLAIGPYDTTAAQTNNGNLQLFAISKQKSLMLKEYDGQQWHKWIDFGGVLSSSPDACSWKQGAVEVFARGVDGRMWQFHFGPGGKKGWNPVGDGTFPDGAGPAAVAPYETVL